MTVPPHLVEELPVLRARVGRVGLVLAAATAALALGAVPASAHVRVSGTGATPGGYSLMTFRVPTEKDDASTTALQVFLPADQPLASVSVQPHPGWTAVVHTRTLAQPIRTDDGPVTEVASDVLWTADTPAAGIAPKQFDQFSILAGPLPDVPALTLPADQTYSDGEVVAWNQTAAPGAPEPEHPAPSLRIGPADGSSAAPAPSAGSGAALPVAIVALVVAVLALLGLAVAVLRGRR